MKVLLNGRAALLMLSIAIPAMLTHSGSTLAQQKAATDTQAKAVPAAAATNAAEAPEPLSPDEMEVLVARIALYPDELVAVISSASLFPLQIVEAARYLDKYAKDKSLKPKDSWDGSVISLLNYPEIVRMMSTDLEWTQSLGDAIAYQQKDLLVAIQQLRDEAVAKGIIKTDDKIKVVKEDDNVVIQSASPEKIYVPQYAPEMLYEPDYVPVPIAYYPEPYPNYYYPGATFFAAAITGAIWASAIDWNDWGVWGGRWNGGDVDIDCNNCFNNNFRGKVNFNDIDWKNVDRSKLNFDRNQINKLDRTNIKNRIEANPGNNLRDRASDMKKGRADTRPAMADRSRDIRKSTAEGLKNRDASARPDRPTQNARDVQRPQTKQAQARPASSKKQGNVSRPSGKPKPAARVDSRPRSPSALGQVGSGRQQKMYSNRGGRSMGGGSMHRGGGGHRQMGGGGHRGGGGRRR